MAAVRILVVDDSVVVRKLLSEALAATPGIQLAGTASSGTIALAKIPQLNPDLITLDVEMPGLNGIETLKEIRRLYPKLPVSASTSTTTAKCSSSKALDLIFCCNVLIYFDLNSKRRVMQHFYSNLLS